METATKLKANPQCKDCWGRGILRIMPLELNASKYRELRPCHCVKAIVKLSDLEGNEESEHKAII